MNKGCTLERYVAALEDGSFTTQIHRYFIANPMSTVKTNFGHGLRLLCQQYVVFKPGKYAHNMCMWQPEKCTNGMTVSFWLKIENEDPTNRCKAMFTRILQIKSDGIDISVSVNDLLWTKPNVIINGQTVIMGLAIMPRVWTHIAFSLIYNQSTENIQATELFYNGTAKAYFLGSVPRKTTQHAGSKGKEITIGWSGSGCSCYPSFTIDEILMLEEAGNGYSLDRLIRAYY